MPTTEEYLQMLNEQQKEAVLEHTHPLLVLAGAGSGKTRVITTKIAYFIDELGCDPRSVLAVTFTNKAAMEMKERLRQMVDGAELASVRTFHAFGAWLLRRYSKEAGLSDHFTIYDDEDAVTLLHSICPDYKRKELKPYAKWISKAKDYCLTPTDDLSPITFDSKFPRMYESYEKKMRSVGNADFGDLIKKSVELLQKNPQIRKQVCMRFRVILVDEYQDSNAAQFKLLQQLFTPNTFLCVVGDDDQSIYRFRGAELKNILTFPDHFPNTRIITLEQNYRSTATILSIASEVVKNNKGRHKKVLRTDREQGSKASLNFFEDQYAEAQYCADMVSRDHRYDDTAILYRTNAQSAAFETIFMKRKIPYKIIGALKFYDREEIKDALALLSLCLNPFDEVAFRRVINKPSRGIGTSSLDKIIAEAGDFRGDCIEGLSSAVDSVLKGKAKSGSSEFLTCYKRAVERLDEMELAFFTQETLTEFGVLDHYRQQDKIASTQKLLNLQELVNAISLYEKGRVGLATFLETLELDPSTVGKKNPLDQPGVTLITMHNTKGLEFDRVIISGMEEGLFPGRANESDEDIEEERRIFYVSITRARDELYFTACRRRSLWGKTQYPAPSRFLDELPDDHVETVGRPPMSYGAAGSYGTGERDVYTPSLERFRKPEPSAFAKSIASDAKKKASSTEDSGCQFTQGDKVYHDAYGTGYIKTSVMESGREKVTVQFESGGEKTFLPKYAPLEKIAKDW